MTTASLPTRPDDPRIEVRRSKRRKRTVSARREGEKVVVLMPAGLSRAEEHRLIADMLGRLGRSRRRAGAQASDDQLIRRAERLSSRWLEGEPRPSSVRWVPSMTTRWASCSPESGAIRISEALRHVPAYVLDYVLVHELAHLVVPGGHPPEFWQAVRAFPQTERAMGYLEAYARTLRSDGAGGDPGAERGGAEAGGDDAALSDTALADGEGVGDLIYHDEPTPPHDDEPTLR